ncbi:hypothetical protein PS639_05341 [Pseudomonas fluorescens]|nr:hypothetical protein PS639_05341 [Pseudomonas fluorescens]
MNRRRQILQHQQQRFHRHASNCDAYAFFNLLTAPELLQRVESALPEYRERLFPPTETLSMFLAQAMSADRSCQNAVNDLSIKRSCGGIKPNSIRTGAYCKARKRLPVEMVSTLVKYTGASISDQAPSSWRWMGRPVRLVEAYDGQHARHRGQSGCLSAVSRSESRSWFPAVSSGWHRLPLQRRRFRCRPWAFPRQGWR